MEKCLTHLNEKGEASMVDVGDKPVMHREARAQAIVRMQPQTLLRILSSGLPKGDVFGCARIAGILAAKDTARLIPLCHPLPLDDVQVEFLPLDETRIRITATARCTGRTGVEMEALTAVTVAALTVYDMCKAIDRAMEITDVYLLEKSGGRSGHFVRGEDAAYGEDR